ncbi:cyanophycinase [Aliidiomarina haloalkalitolerans]|uniref:Cyanophycinase n=1 Tax=Aliidiomarina haloalkalitolerans TaxID=859059 RepID=A0A432VRH3_9GAMM|nr:cyanophycinase [Aliidiomarina haloalkalitolerans]RUO18904.1 cyanophycinase [Aliidiomarina haloalkalitolerans]
MSSFWSRLWKVTLSSAFALSASVLVVLALVQSVTPAHAQSSTDPQWNVMLTGSELRLCSSMNSDYCSSTDWINANEMRTARLFQLTDVRRREALRRAVWPRERDEVREELSVVLEEMVDFFARGVVPEYRLVERFRSRAYLDLLMRLSEAEYDRVLDNLEMPRLEGLDEHVNLAANADYSAEFVTRFVAMAEDQQQRNGREGKPLILVVTAGERDTFRSVDSHVAAFKQAGADAVWLPADVAVRAAREANECRALESYRRQLSGNYDRDRVHPSRHAEQLAYCSNVAQAEQLIQQASAVFFTGGSAQRLFRALQGSAELALLQTRFSEGKLAVGGAGAGAQAMVATNMLTNGHSRDAIRNGAFAATAPMPGCDLDNTCPRGLNPNSLTYEPLGGFGMLRNLIVDTDVSHRGRQGRLLRLAASTNAPLAIGLDRDTAMLMNSASGAFELIGQDGALFLEGAQGNDSMLAATFHYLRSGSMGRIESGRLHTAVLAAQQPQRLESITTRFLGDTGVYDNLDSVCRGSQQLRLLQETFVLQMLASEDSEIERTAGRCQVTNGVIGVAIQAP